jgi:hypothetical protein
METKTCEFEKLGRLDFKKGRDKESERRQQ